MSEYDIAFDNQMDWCSFWSSPHGWDMFASLYKEIEKQRQENGETKEWKITDYIDDEIAIVLTSLINGECYYWSPDMLGVIKIASESLPSNWSLMKEHIPAVSGFFWLSKERDRTVAIAWNVCSVDRTEGKLGHPAAIYLPRPEHDMPDFNAITIVTFVSNPYFPKPIPARNSLYVGESLQDWKWATLNESAKLNADPKVFEADYENLRFFATMLSFLQQRIMVPSRYSISRATRRRMSNLRVETRDVNVIKLRALTYYAHKGEGEEIDWQCRWIVRGHWRHQWYPSIRKHQPIFIAPYIKGPENKPLRDPRRLFAVVR